jgi:hypothetical protein
LADGEHARECTETLQYGHVRAFESFGGVPSRISYENAKTSVSQDHRSARAQTHERLPATTESLSVRGAFLSGAQAQRQERQLERLLNHLEKPHLLVLDELGYVPFSKAGAELLFEVISRAYERQSLILTTNLPFEQWTEILGNERLIGALLDRITHRVHIIEANGESYRLKDTKKKSSKAHKEVDPESWTVR